MNAVGDESAVAIEETKPELEPERELLNASTVKKILFWWGLTIPATMSTTALISWIFLSIRDP